MTFRQAIVELAGVASIAAAVLAARPADATDKLGARSARGAGVAVHAAGLFTPAAADPRMAAAFARGGLDAGDFRFTPAETRSNPRAVTVAVRARGNRGLDAGRLASAQPATVGLAPVAYNLGVAVGWRRFALAGDVTHIDMAGKPGSGEAADVSVSYSLQRFSGRVKAAADRPLGNEPRLLGDVPTYSVDVGGSYALTRNLDVTAGVRYRTDRERLQRLDDNRRDSQAVYLGTAFRF